MAQHRPPRGATNVALHQSPREGTPVVPAEHSAAEQMSMLAQCRCESYRERYVPEPSSFRRRHMTFPVGSLDAELTFVEVNICPVEGHHLAAPEPTLTAKQHDERGLPAPDRPFSPAARSRRSHGSVLMTSARGVA